MYLKKILLLLAVFLPQPVKLFCYRRFFGWQIGNLVTIGFSYIDSQQVKIGDNTRIGHFNIIRNIKQLEIGEKCYIANFNEFFGNPRQDSTWSRKLLIGNKVLIMSHHFIDVLGSVTRGDRTTIGGRNSHFWTHSLINEGGILKLQETDIEIGENSYIGARATLIGCKIPKNSIVGAGSIVNKSFSEESNYSLLIVGNPASIKKRYEIHSFELAQQKY